MSYESNNLTTLKKEALIQKDVAMLSNIMQFVAEEAQRIFYYKRISEDTLRNKAGEIVDSAMLEIPWHKLWEVLWCVEFAALLGTHKSEPGALLRDITDRPGYRDVSKIILEVPDETAFPIPEDFDWIGVCQEYIKSTNYRTIEHRLDGHQFRKIIHYLKKEPYSQGVTLVNIDSLSQEQIDEYLDLN